MTEYIFKSGLAVEIKNYLEYKTNSGFKEKSYLKRFKQFDRFCINRGISDVSFTKDDFNEWSVKRSNEADTTHYTRVNFVKNFLIYLSRKGYDVYVGKDIKSIPTDFTPHIYTDDEIRRYFHTVDTYNPHGGNKKNLIQLPVMFRFLYCCGTRINETLGIRKKDVDIENGIVALYETKNDAARYIVLSDEMKELIKKFADKCFYMIEDDGYIFTNLNGKRIDGQTIYELHRKFLDQAGISYLGDGHGPRVHDWRHTFAVNSFKKLADAGTDLYVALPILSTYLGHKTIYATEKYLRLTVSIYPYIEKKWSDKINDIFGKAAALYDQD